MELKLGKSKNKVLVDKLFVNKVVKKAPLYIWFNNLTFSDFIFLEKMNNAIFNDCDIFGTSNSSLDYKKNILFYNETDKNIYLYCGCFISVLEKDRCSLKYDKLYKIERKKYKKLLENVIKSEIRKEKISLLLNEY